MQLTENEGKAYLLVILETILVLIGLLTTNDRASERLHFFWEGELRYVGTVHECLLSQPLCEICLVAIAHLVVLEGCLQLLLAEAGALFAEQSLSGLINCTIKPRHASVETSVSETHIHPGDAHHWLVETAEEIHIQFSWCAGMRRLGRSQAVGHWQCAECGSIDRGDSGVVGKIELLRGSWGGRRGCAQALVVLHVICHVDIKWL